MRLAERSILYLCGRSSARVERPPIPREAFEVDSVIPLILNSSHDGMRLTSAASPPRPGWDMSSQRVTAGNGNSPASSGIASPIRLLPRSTPRVRTKSSVATCSMARAERCEPSHELSIMPS